MDGPLKEKQRSPTSRSPEKRSHKGASRGAYFQSDQQCRREPLAIESSSVTAYRPPGAHEQAGTPEPPRSTLAMRNAAYLGVHPR